MPANLDDESDDRFAALFGAAGRDDPPPDRAFLARLREDSLRAFLEAAPELSTPVPASQAQPAVMLATASSVTPRAPERRSMLLVTVRVLVTCVLVVAGFTAWVNTPAPPSSASAPSLSEVLKRTAEKESVVLAWDDGREFHRWGRQYRIDNADDSYIIGDGTSAYLVIPQDNQAAPIEPPVNFYADGNASTFFELLDVDPQPALKQAESAEPELVNGRLHYGFTTEAVNGVTHRFRAIANPTTKTLEELVLQDAQVADVNAGAIAVDGPAPAQRPAVQRPAVREKALKVLAFNVPPDEKLFEVQDTLTADGRIGKVLDVQGLVSIRPANQDRWTPVCGRLALKPGDWLRTDLRGANAVSLRLVKSTELILGPGTQVELLKPNEVRLHYGELELTAEEKAPVELLGNAEDKVPVKGTRFYRRQRDQLALVAPGRVPKWLAGFKGALTHESIGSLVANSVGDDVDARNVSLSVGYHRVTVDIRDQIARTTIEESFVNHTASRMEGVFHFPLPADASISGFGMWIGNELVEADVVEKQRAREIYETILRENRDPGLLEWAGGNIFKARVFPIEAHSEKRIKLTYTQVIPLRGGRYRYSYALQSELLKQHPLRELQLNVRINSTIPIKSVSCPTHTVRTMAGKNSASVEFSAQEYTPTRDFEVSVETERTAGNVVLIPHRRGDDGYFLLQIMPEGNGVWEREILPDAGPVNLLVVADTSASMNQPARESQAEFIAATLASLTPKDSFNLATCDVQSDWVFPQSQAATPQNVAAARDQLAQRVSLGWTNLDVAFQSAFAQAKAGTQIVYVGDAVSTIGDANPNAAADRIKQLYGGNGTCHAVIVGSSYEAATVNAIASLGGGSVRRISGEQGPQPTALELLTEITRPGLRDLEVAFRGLRTAAVYPGTLPNLPLGSQQIILGRYLPQGSEHSGEVVVTGTHKGQPVRYTAKVSFQDAEQGNDFIPRLWAKMHVDYLLEQGSSEVIRDQIIALSEEFHVMTPYTSLLVLETDADRERFKVKRRFQMRDGEQFFQEGRDNVKYELARLQMLRARTWRIELRQNVLRSLARMGRLPQAFERELPLIYSPQDKWFAARGGDLPANMPGEPLLSFGRLSRDGRRPYLTAGDELDVSGFKSSERELLSLGESEFYKRRSGLELYDVMDREESDFDGAELKELRKELVDEQLSDFGESEFATERLKQLSREPLFANGFDADSDRLNAAGAFGAWAVNGPEAPGPGLAAKANAGYFFRGRRQERWHGSRWWESLFPSLPPVAKPVEPKPAEGWTPEAVELAKSLLRTEALKKVSGLEIVRQSESFDTRGDLSDRSRARELVGQNTWLVHSASDRSATVVQWCDANERAVMNLAFQLGRTRKPGETEPSSPPLGLNDHSLTPLSNSYAGYKITVERPQDGQAVIVLVNPNDPYEMRFVIDTQRNVLLRSETRRGGEVIGQTVFSQFVEVAGMWWAQRIETKNAKGVTTHVVTQTVTALDAEKVQAEIATEIAPRNRVQFLPVEAPRLADARRAIAAGNGTFADRLVLVIHYTMTQQWTVVMEHLEAAEKLAADKPGVAWIRLAVLKDSRRHEEFKTWLQQLADRVVAMPKAGAMSGDRYALTNHVFSEASQVLQANEMLALLDQLKPVYDAQEAYVKAVQSWQQHRAGQLDNAGRVEDATALYRTVAEQNPKDASAQRNYAQRLVNTGDYEAAYAWVSKALTSGVAWETHEADELYAAQASWLEAQGRFVDLIAFTQEWAKANPENQSAYSMWLSAVFRANRVVEGEALLKKWITEGIAPGADAAAHVRITAAVYLALGNGHNLYRQQIPDEWLQEVQKVALALILDETRTYPINFIMGNWRFRNSDFVQPVRQKAADILKEQAGTLRPETVLRLTEWMVELPDLSAETWKAIVAALQARWGDTANPQHRHTLGQAILRILNHKGTVEERLAFHRQQVAEGPEEHRAGYISALFDDLLGQPWTEAFEAELFVLLPRIAETNTDEVERQVAQVAALHRLIDALQQTRLQASRKAIEHPENLTGKEKAELEKKALRSAREGLIARLKGEQPKHAASLGQWIEMERIGLEVRHALDVEPNRNFAEIIARCWEFLPKEPFVPNEDEDEEVTRREYLPRMLQGRALAVLMFLGTRSTADAALVERIGAYLDAGIQAEGAEDGFWKNFKYQWLVARDKPDELQAVLRQWTQADDPNAFWRISLGLLLAETNAIAEAISQFEVAAKENLLGPAEYRTLADWYMAVDRRSESDGAKIRQFQTAEEWQLRQHLNQWINRAQNASPPLPLDDNILLVFRAALQKTTSPHDLGWILGSYYRHYRDFRLLQGMADSMPGHTALSVYPYLQTLRSYVMHEIREEATVDATVKHLDTVREQAKTAVDRRALDLLEFLLERRAAELPNQPGPHAAKALAALQRAWKHEWSPGEERLVAEFLANVGSISVKSLGDEQLRQLSELHRRSVAGETDAVFIAMHFSSAVANYDRREEAASLLRAALDQYAEKHGGSLPASLQTPITQLVSHYESLKHYMEAEKYLLSLLQKPSTTEHRHWLKRRLFETYTGTLRNDGRVSLGAGQTLFEALIKRLIEELSEADQNYRYEVVSWTCRVFRTAHDKNLRDVGPKLRAYAIDHIPVLLSKQTNNYQSVITQVSSTLEHVIGTRAALSFLITQAENEPEWFRWTSQNLWYHSGDTMASYAHELKFNLGDLDARLLKIVLRELRTELETRQHNNHRSIYNIGNQYFWAAKADTFAKVAEEVYVPRKSSGKAVDFIARYLHDNLHRFDRAIEMLSVADREGVLDYLGQYHLAVYLHGRDRYGESIPLLRRMIAAAPDGLRDNRTLLLTAYTRTNQPNEFLSLLKQTEKHFRDAKRWTADVAASLANSCLDAKLYDRSVAYYREAIERHEAASQSRGARDDTLWQYYTHQAEAYSGLGQTANAVDALMSAIHVWSGRQDRRGEILQTLDTILRNAKDLPAYIAQLDKTAAETNQDRPVVRKALGKVLASQEKSAEAAAQYEIALRLEPNDKEIFDGLIAAYTALKRPEEVLRVTLQAIQLHPRDLARYTALGELFTNQEKPQQAERAWTSMIDMQPNESESHTALAAIREKQNRWNEAVHHWERVAEIRKLEPEGLLGLAKAQLHQKQTEELRETIRTLQKTEWPERLRNTVESEVRELERRLSETK